MFSQSGACFNQPVYSPIPAQQIAFTIVTDDFNSDGFKDIITTGPTLILSNGAGSFNAPFSYTNVSCYVGGSGDFNGDGNTDLVGLKGNQDSILLLFGTGTGSFSSFSAFKVANVPIQTIVKDLNNDGNQDVIALGNSANVAVLYGTGTGSFAPSVNFLVGAASNILSEDFNNDGLTDLAASTGTSVAFYKQNTNNTFSYVTMINLGNYSISGNANKHIVAADFNSDGNMDIASLAGNSISLVKGSGNFFFTSSTNYPCSSVKSITVLDHNLDGNPDLAAISGCSITILQGSLSGTLSSINSYSLNGCGMINGDPWIILTTELNNDSKPDLIVGGDVNLSVNAFLNCTTVGIDETQWSPSLSVFPNPVKDDLTIQYSPNGISNLSITFFNSLGQIVKEGQYNSFGNSINLSVSDLPGGLYTLTLKSNKGYSQSKKIIVSR